MESRVQLFQQLPTFAYFLIFAYTHEEQQVLDLMKVLSHSSQEFAVTNRETLQFFCKSDKKINRSLRIKSETCLYISPKITYIDDFKIAQKKRFEQEFLNQFEKVLKISKFEIYRRKRGPFNNTINSFKHIIREKVNNFRLYYPELKYQDEYRMVQEDLNLIDFKIISNLQFSDIGDFSENTYVNEPNHQFWDTIFRKGQCICMQFPSNAPDSFESYLQNVNKIETKQLKLIECQPIWIANFYSIDVFCKFQSLESLKLHYILSKDDKEPRDLQYFPKFMNLKVLKICVPCFYMEYLQNCRCLVKLKLSCREFINDESDSNQIQKLRSLSLTIYAGSRISLIHDLVTQLESIEKVHLTSFQLTSQNLLFQNSKHLQTAIFRQCFTSSYENLSSILCSKTIRVCNIQVFFNINDPQNSILFQNNYSIKKLQISISLSSNDDRNNQEICWPIVNFIKHLIKLNELVFYLNRRRENQDCRIINLILQEKQWIKLTIQNMREGTLAEIIKPVQYEEPYFLKELIIGNVKGVELTRLVKMLKYNKSLYNLRFRTNDNAQLTSLFKEFFAAISVHPKLQFVHLIHSLSYYELIQHKLAEHILQHCGKLKELRIQSLESQKPSVIDKPLWREFKRQLITNAASCLPQMKYFLID